jgi:GTP cyclohydrolase III
MEMSAQDESRSVEAEPQQGVIDDRLEIAHLDNIISREMADEKSTTMLSSEQLKG